MMPTFIRLATFTDQGIKNVKKFPKMIEEVRETMEQHGVRLLQGWATLGEYDIVAVIDAPDAQTAAQVSALIGAKGNFRAKTLAAIPIADFSDLVKEG